ncbi:2-nitropropane dioxygenase [Neosynechococcus sphagnicola sy1]|uniref:2-nitropropane dioxygenase n=1 Tax=Neosynechococcus sphagnicola sy1 TaxID=1497020 RepID=A0A098TI11_9CYAN|nr:nitronate monooxygenase family protein [Neosynechococcus sphagnicola]KGF72215.1 2-nitropropane dioxygenase [Neosynechococcus sphagnicola sy1]
MKLLSPLRIGQHVARHPILQGGMAVRVSGAKLAGAVANAGGIGVISTLGLGLTSPHLEPQGSPSKKGRFFEANRLALIEELHQARAISPNGVIGVNVLVAMRDYPVLARTAAEQGANLILVGAGLPLDLPEYTADYPNVALVPLVSTVATARKICEHWQRQYGRLPDGLVANCPETVGGHVGVQSEALMNDCSLKQLIPDLVNYLHDEVELPIPVIAAGGVWNRMDIDKMLAFGASGVQIGTRFILTHECDADPRYKEFHLQAQPADVVIVPSPVGVPARGLRNSFTDQAIAASSRSTSLAPLTTTAVLSRFSKDRCIANCLHTCLYRDQQETYCLIQSLHRAAGGDVENGLVFSGTHTGQADRILTVSELMAELTLN